MFINWNYAPWDESVIPESKRQDEPLTHVAEEEKEEIERGDFKEILNQIDQYVQSLINKTESSEPEKKEEDELQETTA